MLLSRYYYYNYATYCSACDNLIFGELAEADLGNILSVYYTLRNLICTIYNMSGRVVSDIQTRAEGESLYIRYHTDANVVNDLKNDSSYEFIGEVILKINVV